MHRIRVLIFQVESREQIIHNMRLRQSVNLLNRFVNEDNCDDMSSLSNHSGLSMATKKGDELSYAKSPNLNGLVKTFHSVYSCVYDIKDGSTLRNIFEYT